MIDSLDEAICLINNQGELIHSNESFKSLFDLLEKNELDKFIFSEHFEIRHFVEEVSNNKDCLETKAELIDNVTNEKFIVSIKNLEKENELLLLKICNNRDQKDKTSINLLENKIEFFRKKLSHDFRASLTNIVGLGELAEKETGNQRVKEVLEQANILDDKIKEIVSYLNDFKDTPKFGDYKFEKPIRNIVLIDDDKIQHLLNEKIIGNYSNLNSRSFLSAETALKTIENNKIIPDVIFLDINMPEMDGWTFLDKFQSKFDSIPVFMLSSSTDNDDIKKAVEYPCVKGFLLKPLTHDTLSSLIAL